MAVKKHWLASTWQLIYSASGNCESPSANFVMCPCTTPEHESHGLINCMHKSKHCDEGTSCNIADETIAGIRKRMLTESARQTPYIDIICDLLDDSVEYNNLKQVAHPSHAKVCFLSKTIIAGKHVRRKGHLRRTSCHLQGLLLHQTHVQIQRGQPKLLCNCDQLPGKVQDHTSRSCLDLKNHPATSFGSCDVSNQVP
jgi:hypothetical protein